MADLPQNLSELPGYEKAEQYTGVDVDGQHYTPAQVKQDAALSDVVRGKASTLYRTSTGSWTTDINSAAPTDTSVSLDKNTGRITIKAPESVLNTDTFKQNFNTDVLKTISKNYKINSDYKYPDPQDDTKEVTAEELVNRYDTGVKELAKSVANINELANTTLRQQFGDKVDNMSYEDKAIALMPTYDVGDIKVSSTTAIHIPDFLLDQTGYYADLAGQIKSLKTFNAETGTVERGDFMENFWNREKNDKLTQEKIQDISNALATHLKYSDWKNVSETDEDGEYFENNGSTEAAKAYSFYNFIQGQDPNRSGWQAIGDSASSLINGIGRGVQTFALGIMSGVEWLTNLNPLSARRVGTFAATGNANALNPLANRSTVVKETLEGWEDWKAYDNEQLKLLSDSSAAITSIADNITQLGLDIAVGAIATGGLGEVAAGAANSVKAGSSLQKFLGGIAMGLNASGDVSKTIKAAGEAQKLVSAGKLVGSSADIMTQAIVDSAVQNPTLFRKVVDGEGGEEGYKYMLEQAAWNVGGWAAGLGITKGMMKAGKTEFAQAVNAATAKGIAKLRVGTTGMADSLKNKIVRRSLDNNVTSKIDTIQENVTKGNNRKAYRQAVNAQIDDQKRVLRDELKAFADADIDIFDGLKINKDQLAEAQKYMTQIKALENAVDAEQRSLKFLAGTYDNSLINPTMAKIDSKLFKNKKDIMKAEKGLGLTPMKGTVYSQEASNYIGAVVERQYMQSVIDNPEYFAEGTVRSAKKNIGTYDDAINNLKEKLGTELTTLLDGDIADLRKWYEAMSEYRASKGITNNRELDDLLANPMFSSGDYLRVQRLRDSRGLRVVREDGTSLIKNDAEFQHLEFSEFSDFQAPDLVRQNYKYSTANLERNKGVLEARLAGHGASKTTLASGEETQFVKDIKRTQVEFNKLGNELATKLANSKDNVAFSPDSLVKKYSEFSKKVSAQNAAEREAIKASRATERAKTKNVRVNNIDRANAVGSLSNGEVSELVSESVPLDQINFTNPTQVDEDIFDMIVDSLPNETKRLMVDKIKEANRYLGIRDDLSSMVPAVSSTRTGAEEISRLEGSPLPNRSVSATDQVIADRDAYNNLVGQLDSNRIVEMPPAARATDDSLRDIPGLERPYTSVDSSTTTAQATRSSDTYDEIVKQSSEEGSSLSNYDQMVSGGVRRNDSLTLENFTRAKNFVDSMESNNLITQVQRSALRNDKSYRDIITKKAENIKRAEDVYLKEQVLSDARNKLSKAMGEVETDNYLDSVLSFTDDSTDDFIESMKSDPKASAHIRAMANMTGDNFDDVARYMALSNLSKNSKLVTDKIEASFYKVRGQRISKTEFDSIVKNTKKAYTSTLESKLNDARLALDNSPLVDGKVYDDIKKLNKDIYEYEGMAADVTSNVIKTTDAQGRVTFIETDPAIASLYKTRPDESLNQMNAVSKVNYGLSKLFRLGTTALNISAVARQWFRDTGNAMFMGGAFNMIKTNANELTEELGERIVNQLSKFEYKEVSRIAEETGKTIEEVAVARELAQGKSIVQASTETALYTGANTYAEVVEGQMSPIKRMKQAVDNTYNKLENLMNGKRENYLRNRVYASNLNDSLKAGMTLDQARVAAEFAMNNATTNFGRKLRHLQGIADSTPYFSAAINGTKSFYRMLALDPVGITTRFMGGLAVPTMYLVGSSLIDENDRKIYENIPEYQKDDNITFVHNGQVFQIPIPQELSPFLSPFRQFVEYLHGANKNDFWELMGNDILGLSPIDLTGFSTIDMDQMISDPTFLDRMGRGVSRVFSQIAPVPIKSAYLIGQQAFQGYAIDPYSGKRITDATYGYWNPDTESYEVMDYNQELIAKHIGQWTGWNNEAVISRVLSGIFGKAGVDFLNTIAGIGGLVRGENDVTGALSGLQSQIEDIGGSFAADTYNQTNAVWRRAINELETERDNIINSDEFQTYNNQLSQATDPEERKKLMAKRDDMLSDWYKKVSGTVTNLVDKYGGTFDRYKYAAVLQLVNLNSAPNWAAGNAYLQELSSQNYYAGKNEAVRKLNELGINGTNDLSIFGYVKYNNRGEAGIVYSTPTGILDAANTVLSASKINQANIEKLIKGADLSGKRSTMYDQINVIRGKSKLSSSDYNKIDELKMAFNNEVVSAIAPYLNRMTSDAIVNDENIMDILENYIQVPSAYEKIKNRYVSSGNGKLNKQQGFVRSYIKALYKEANKK